jgi:hypothetical protein
MGERMTSSAAKGCAQKGIVFLMDPQRFYDLEHEYRQLSELIARVVNSDTRASLVQHRKEIVAEAREIENKLSFSYPRWCDSI